MDLNIGLVKSGYSQHISIKYKVEATIEKGMRTGKKNRVYESNEVDTLQEVNSILKWLEQEGLIEGEVIADLSVLTINELSFIKEKKVENM
ncbi:hypothetical protein [Sebaldella sp. S0638]|uniref:hypothetical protein n=1 Tax=Sebaldella sp. S0638 TaxID=2957809 RepID=UPI00209CC4D7|nr:hypothetical protein [Sebaldella sp. S0638]MCP1226208.1 hypothetical protein [Sebaldella sp. S0638]